MRTLFDLNPEPKTASEFAQRFRPRPYQEEAIQNFFRLTDEGADGALIRLVTGGGKTFLGSWSISRWLDRSPDHCAIVFAHERQLVTQFAQEIQDLLGLPVGIEMADRTVRTGPLAPRIVVASRQTLMENKDGESRLYKFDWQKNWLQVIDECHRWTWSMKSCRHIIEWFSQNPFSKRLGLTATPKRSDGVTFERLFPSVALDYRMYDLSGGPCAVNDGWAVPYDQRFIEVAGVDFNNIKEVAGDFQAEELDEILSQKEQLDSLVLPMLDLVGSRRTIIFNPGVGMSHAVANMINAERKYRIAKGLPCDFGKAESLDGSADEISRERAFQSHQRGEIQFLSVCGLCREGYNDPGIEAVAIFRPTKSQALAEQMKGRGCRPLKGIVDGLASSEERLAAIRNSSKPNCMIIDLVGATGLGDVASTAQLIAEGLPDEVIARANTNAKKKQELSEDDEVIDMQQELRLAAAEIDAEEKEKNRLEKEAARKKAEKESKIRSEVKYHQRQVGHDDYIPDQSQVARQDGVMPFGKYAGKQIDKLPTPYLMWAAKTFGNNRLGQQIQEVLKSRQSQRQQQVTQGQATENQKRALKKHGFETNVSYEEAARIITQHINSQLAGAK